MPKIKIKFWLLIIICLCFLSACSNQNHNNNNIVNQESRWTMNIEGNKVTLPCTMAELEEIGIHLYSEYDENMIYESQNETFNIISAVYKDSDEMLYLSMVTGDNPEKKAANAKVVAITNMMLDADSFNLKGSFGIGASIDDMIEELGDDYLVSGATKDDIRAGFTVINYGTAPDNVILNFDKDKLIFIEVQYNEN